MTHGADTRRHKLTGDVHLLLLNTDGQVLFGRRQNTGFEDGAHHLPSGHLEAGESVVEALIREAKEEVGVTVAPEAVEFSHIMHSSSSGGRVAFFFTVQQWEGTPENREPEKCSELSWFPLDALPAHLIDYFRVALTHRAAWPPGSTRSSPGAASARHRGCLLPPRRRQVARVSMICGSGILSARSRRSPM
ncbi:MAG TPA: NUDIX domain-containing protein [Streptosporangiaceae bacterium]